MSVLISKVDENQQKVEAVLKSLAIPSEIERWDTRFGTDSTGDPAAWITFHVKPQVNVDTAKLNELSDFATKVTQALLEDDTVGFPYTLLEQAA
jgi:hypothetical protein